MGTVDGMLAAARIWLGTGETPENSNRNVFTDWYGAGSMPWCDAFVSYVAAHSDNAAAVGRFAWTPSHAESFRAQGRWHYGLGGARPGDIVFFDWGGTRTIGSIDHVGIVEAARADGTVVTIEGNSDNVVARRVRGPATVVGYGRPAYDDAAAMPASDGILRRGAIGDQVRALQVGLNGAGARITVDGVFGAATELALRAFQRAHGLSVDGEYGPASAAALKAALAGKTAPIRPVPVVAKAVPLAVDGLLGPATVRALQRHLGVGVDGIIGPTTRKALQRRLGVTPDGIVGPTTVRALQHWVGATQDGIWGAGTTRALQRKLSGA